MEVSKTQREESSFKDLMKSTTSFVDIGTSRDKASSEEVEENLSQQSSEIMESVTPQHSDLVKVPINQNLVRLGQFKEDLLKFFGGILKQCSEVDCDNIASFIDDDYDMYCTKHKDIVEFSKRSLIEDNTRYSFLSCYYM